MSTLDGPQTRWSSPAPPTPARPRSPRDRPTPGHTPARSRAWERRLSPLRPFDGENRRRGAGRLVVASNRLPVTVTPADGGRWTASPAAGGLVTALDPVLRHRGGVWTGWAGAPEVDSKTLGSALRQSASRPPYRLAAVPLSQRDEALFYRGFSNRVLWPLFHGFEELIEAREDFWRIYRKVNRRFARALVDEARWDDLLWIHDYHLLLVGRELRRLECAARAAFFLHTPFPAADALARLPWGSALVEGLLAFDLVGFQTTADRDAFLAAVRRFAPGAFPHGATTPDPVVHGRTVRTGAFPISIDAEEFTSGPSRPVVEAMTRELRREAGDRTLLVGVDRLDYSKGIPEKLEGFREALRRHPELRERVVLDQLVVPSRSEVPAYAETRARIDALVRDINAEWSRSGWLPVRYEYGTWTRSELLARYRAADAALVTPLADGMNLVAKEYVTAGPDDGLLILSAFAGAAGQLAEGALLVNPRDSDALARAVLDAHRMPPAERRRRMAAARRAVRNHDVHRWARAFLAESVRAG